MRRQGRGHRVDGYYNIPARPSRPMWWLVDHAPAQHLRNHVLVPKATNSVSICNRHLKQKNGQCLDGLDWGWGYLQVKNGLFNFCFLCLICNSNLCHQEWLASGIILLHLFPLLCLVASTVLFLLLLYWIRETCHSPQREVWPSPIGISVYQYYKLTDWKRAVTHQVIRCVPAWPSMWWAFFFFFFHNIYYIYRHCTRRISYWACKHKISNWWLRQYFSRCFAYWFITIVYCSVPVFHQKACMALVQSVQVMQFEYYFQTKWN